MSYSVQLKTKGQKFNVTGNDGWAVWVWPAKVSSAGSSPYVVTLDYSNGAATTTTEVSAVGAGNTNDPAGGAVASLVNSLTWTGVTSGGD
jgi:hypothetical protein